MCSEIVCQCVHSRIYVIEGANLWPYSHCRGVLILLGILMSLTCGSSYEFNVFGNKLVKIRGFLSFKQLIFYKLVVRLHIVLAYICYEMLCVNHIIAAIIFSE